MSPLPKRNRGLPDGVVTHACLDEPQGPNHLQGYLFGVVVRVVADELDEAFALRLLDILDGDEFVAVDVERNEVHFAPENTEFEVVDLLVEDDVAALEQGIHRIAPDVDGAVAGG